MGIVCSRGLMVSIIKLSPGGQRGESRAVMGEAERGVGDVGARGGRGRGLGIVAARRRLALDLCFGGVGGRRRGLRLLLFGEPRRVTAGGSQSIGVRRGGRARRRGHGGALRVAIGRKVLVELIHVERFDVGHHLVADLADIHGAKVDMGFGV